MYQIIKNIAMPGVGCDNIEIKNNLIIVTIGCFRKWDHKWQNLLIFLFRPLWFYCTYEYHPIGLSLKVFKWFTRILD